MSKLSQNIEREISKPEDFFAFTMNKDDSKKKNKSKQKNKEEDKEDAGYGEGVSAMMRFS